MDRTSSHYEVKQIELRGLPLVLSVEDNIQNIKSCGYYIIEYPVVNITLLNATM